MERITTILPRESARLDAEQLERLYTTLGEVEADNVLSRAMEEMCSAVQWKKWPFASNKVKSFLMQEALRKCDVRFAR